MLLLLDNNTKRWACKAGLLMLRMTVKLTRVTWVVLPNNLTDSRMRLLNMSTTTPSEPGGKQ